MIIDILIDMAKFFTKKVCLITLTVIVALTGIIWAIVANITPKFNSGINTIPAGKYVSGNGTAAVMVDDYLYFIGDSVATSSIEYGENEYFANGVMPDAGIFRVKIGKDSAPILNYEYDNTYLDEETNEKKTWQVGDEKYNSVVTAVKDWEHIFEANNGIEAVVPKIAGHDKEKTAMWVFGQYLIYTSPHNRYDNRGKLMSDYLDFFRVNLDGGNHTLIYTTNSTDLTTKNFTVWADSTKNIYLLINETNNQDEDAKASIKKVNVLTHEVSTLDSNVSNVVLPTATQYKRDSQNENLGQIYGSVMGYVYYTKTREKSNLKGNLLYRCPIKGGNPELIGDAGTVDTGTTFTPLAVTPLENGGAQFVFSIKAATAQTPLVGTNLCAITNRNSENYKYVDADTNSENIGSEEYSVEIYANGFCKMDSKLYHYNFNNDKITWNAQVLSAATIDKVIAVMGETIYFQSGSSVYAVNKNGSSNTISTVIAEDDTATDEDESSSTDSETSADEITLPLAVLYQPEGNTGDPFVFVQTTNYIRLFYSNQKYDYLRFKA